MIWLLYIVLHSLAYAYFNFCFITGVDFHTAQVIAIGVDVTAIFYFMMIKPYDKSFRNIFMMALAFCLFRWVLYDMALNLMLGKGIFYVGSGFLDKLFGIYQYVIKFVLIIVYISLERYFRKR